jgi:hypothetical protein
VVNDGTSNLLLRVSHQLLCQQTAWAPDPDAGPGVYTTVIDTACIARRLPSRGVHRVLGGGDDVFTLHTRRTLPCATILLTWITLDEIHANWKSTGHQATPAASYDSPPFSSLSRSHL